MACTLDHWSLRNHGAGGSDARSHASLSGANTGSGLFFRDGLPAVLNFRRVRNNRIRKLTPDGVISTVAGTGTEGFSGDFGPATAARFSFPRGLALDEAGNLYIADRWNHHIRKVAADGVISTVAGSGTRGFGGDGGLATEAHLSLPRDVALDTAGNLYISDTSNHRIRKVTPDGMISTVAGSGFSPFFRGDGIPASQAALYLPDRVAVDADGSLYIADTFNDRVRKVAPDGMISTVAGTGQPGFSGDGGPVAEAHLNAPTGVAVDLAGNVYIDDAHNSRIRVLLPEGPRIDDPVRAVTVSSASFNPIVAPDSLASIFGTRFSNTEAEAQLDENGQLPTELAGTRVEINGRPAGLLFVSPNQINCFIDPDTEIGAATVTVDSAKTGFISRGEAEVRSVAPGLGAIQNGVTFSGGPFSVETPQNPDSDKRTRLAIYGTGLRFADSVTVAGRDVAGNLWNLPVEYAGPAPGFFGFDQVNVVLPPEASAAGLMSLTASTDSALSNAVELEIRYSAAPSDVSVFPRSEPPGAAGSRRRPAGRTRPSHSGRPRSRTRPRRLVSRAC